MKPAEKGGRELEDFSTLVGLIYDAASEPAGWRAVLDAMRSALGADQVVAIIRADSLGSEGLSFALGDHFHVMRDFFVAQIPSKARFPSDGTHEISVISEQLSRDEWHATDFYRDLCVPQGIEDILSIELRLEDQSAFRLRFTRKAHADRFGESERQIALQLVPHLRRAMRIDQRFAREGVIHRRYVEACDRLGVATFILDERGALLESNSYAQALIEGGSELMLRKGSLVARHTADNRALQDILRQTSTERVGGDRPAQPHVLWLRGEGDTGLNVLVRRVDDAEGARAGRKRPALILFARDPDFHMGNDARVAQRLFDLTQSESALAMRLANGLSLPEAAADMHIRHSTARTHLRAIFAKTGLSRQSSLVRQLLNSVTMLTENIDGAAETGPRGGGRPH